MLSPPLKLAADWSVASHFHCSRRNVKIASFEYHEGGDVSINHSTISPVLQLQS